MHTWSITLLLAIGTLALYIPYRLWRRRYPEIKFGKLPLILIAVGLTSSIATFFYWHYERQEGFFEKPITSIKTLFKFLFPFFRHSNLVETDEWYWVVAGVLTFGGLLLLVWRIWFAIRAKYAFVGALLLVTLLATTATVASIIHEKNNPTIGRPTGLVTTILTLPSEELRHFSKWLAESYDTSGCKDANHVYDRAHPASSLGCKTISFVKRHETIHKIINAVLPCSKPRYCPRDPHDKDSDLLLCNDTCSENFAIAGLIGLFWLALVAEAALRGQAKNSSR